MTDSVDDTDDNRKQLKYGDDAVYVGQQKDGKPHGYGEMTAKTGDTYKGDWVNGKRHGNGKANLADGDEYDGKWVDDMQHGQGILTWSDGKYKGEFERNMMHGHGVMTFDDGNKYVGMWKEDKKHGKGNATFADTGEEYDGDWVNDNFDGYGVWTDERGDTYSGGWQNQQRHGKGIFTPNAHTYDAHMNTYDVVYDNGELQSREPSCIRGIQGLYGEDGPSTLRFDSTFEQVPEEMHKMVMIYLLHSQYLNPDDYAGSRHLRFWLQDKEVATVAARTSGCYLMHMPKELQGDKEMVLTAIHEELFCYEKSAVALEYASEELRADKDVVLAAAQIGGTWILEYASEELRADKEIVDAASVRDEELCAEEPWRATLMRPATSEELARDEELAHDEELAKMRSDEPADGSKRKADTVDSVETNLVHPAATGSRDSVSVKGLHDMDDNVCVMLSLRKSVELLFGAPYAALVTADRLNAMIDLVHSEMNSNGHGEFPREAAGVEGVSFHDNVFKRFLEKMFSKDVVSWEKVRDMKMLLPNTGEKPASIEAVYMTQVDLNNQPGSIASEGLDPKDTDLAHMVLLMPEHNEFFCSFYFINCEAERRKFQRMKTVQKRARFVRHRELEFTPKSMTAEFAQHTDGQISRSVEGTGEGVHPAVTVRRRFKKINRSFKIFKRSEPGSPEELARRFDAKPTTNGRTKTAHPNAPDSVAYDDADDADSIDGDDADATAHTP